jgi:hypothetical protein
LEKEIDSLHVNFKQELEEEIGVLMLLQCGFWRTKEDLWVVVQ